MKRVVSLENSWIEFGSKEENHSMDDFSSVLGNAWHMIGFMLSLNNIVVLNMVGCF